jgi:crossover junction endodeoxyribonuclease RuvC
VRVLGIDPGLAATGYGLVDEAETGYRWVSSGCIRTGPDLPQTRRLEQIFNAILELIRQYRPRSLALEKLFFSRNVRTALQVGEARGIVILAAARSGLELHEYTPLQVKQAVVGYGGAEKGQVQKMIALLLHLPESPAVDDEADALAVAICHLQHRRFAEAVKGRGV